MRTVTCVVGVCLLYSGLTQAQQTPSTYSHPWQVPSTLVAKQQAAARLDPEVILDSDHRYTLPELIDLAEKHNPDTRAAWEAIRVQAGELRVARSDLLPAMAAVAMTNTSRTGVLFGDVFVRQTLGLYQPVLEVNYLVLDFGARAAQIADARQQLLSSSFAFNRSQLDLLFGVMRQYYEVLNAQGQRTAAEVNLRNAVTVRKAIEARLAVGLATRPDALEARAAEAQADFILQQAIGQADSARGDLLVLVGASPLTPLNLQPLDELALPTSLDPDVAGAVQQGFAQRPELGEALAQQEAARAAIKGARSAFFPQLSFTGQGGEVRAFGQQDQLPGVYAGPMEVWNVSLNLRWEIFDGGRREGELARAHADERRAQAQINGTRDEIARQVWVAYVAARTAFAQQQAATQLLAAAQVSYDASLKSLQLGLRSTVDVVTAQRTLAQALSSDVTARTGLLTAVAELAHRTGGLLSNAAGKGKP